MKISAADCGKCHSDHCFAEAGKRYRDTFDSYVVGPTRTKAFIVEVACAWRHIGNERVSQLSITFRDILAYTTWVFAESHCFGTTERSVHRE